MPQREVLHHGAAEVAADQHHLVVAEVVVHEGVEVVAVRGHVVEAVRPQLALPEAPQVRDDHLEAGGRQAVR